MGNRDYTIKDIARMAGVSAGTVDRVLHNRGDVSPVSQEKVRRVLDEIDYQPNMFAIALARKKRYRFVCLIPYYTEHDYWHSVCEGVQRASREFEPFNVSLSYLYYNQADEASYKEACAQLRKKGADGVLMAPNFIGETRQLTLFLEERQIPYTFIDFNIEQTHALCYIGQDSRMSGYITARILMNHYKEGDELALFLNNQKDNPAEIQMQRRLEGFMRYISEHRETPVIHDVVLDKEDAEANRKVLDRFFESHERAVLGVVFNSRVYHVADYLHDAGRRMKGLVGYDLLKRNVERLKGGEVNYLIGQRPAMQGYLGVKALSSHVVFKRPVEPVKYMPIDILIKDNIDFYFEFE